MTNVRPQIERYIMGTFDLRRNNVLIIFMLIAKDFWMFDIDSVV